MSDNIAIGFKNCFICGLKLGKTYWYHNDCYDVNEPKIMNVIHNINHIPLAIPSDQHYRYIRRLYLGRVEYETINKNGH